MGWGQVANLQRATPGKTGDSKIFAASMHYAKCALVFKFGGLQLVLTGLHKLKDQITSEVGASQLAEVGASQLAEACT